MNTIRGRIPTHIVTVIQAEATILQALTETPFTVRPAFAVDATSEKMVALAIRWGKGSTWGDQVQEYTVTEPSPNEPTPYLDLVQYESRGNGGMAYKVAAPNGLYFDLRQQTVLELLFGGLVRGPRLVGPFIWACTGSQMQLLHMETPRYAEYLEATTKAVPKSTKNLAARALTPGQMYQKRNGTIMAFLGRVELEDVSGKFFAWREVYNGQWAGNAVVNLTKASVVCVDLHTEAPKDGRHGISRYTCSTEWAIRPNHVKWA